MESGALFDAAVEATQTQMPGAPHRRVRRLTTVTLVLKDAGAIRQGPPAGLIASKCTNKGVTSSALVPLIILDPTDVATPVILSFTLVGSFVLLECALDMGLAVTFGILGHVVRKTN